MVFGEVELAKTWFCHLFKIRNTYAQLWELSELSLKMKHNLSLGHGLDLLMKLSKRDFPFPKY